MKHLLLAICLCLSLLAFGSVVLAQDDGQIYLPMVSDGNEEPAPTVTTPPEGTPIEVTPIVTETPIPTQEPEPTATPEPDYAPGEYAGSMSTAFTATDDGQVCDFSIKIRSGPSTCTIHPVQCAPIVDSQFVFTSSIPGATYGITGTWSTATTVEGTHSTFIWCENVIMIFGGTPSWTAEKTN